MKIKQLKEVINKLPDDMDVVIVEQDSVCHPIETAEVKPIFKFKDCDDDENPYGEVPWSDDEIDPTAIITFVLSIWSFSNDELQKLNPEGVRTLKRLEEQYQDDPKEHARKVLGLWEE